VTEYVLDASVAAKWFLDDEAHVEEATDYLVLMLADDITFHAPVLLQYEFGNILTKAQRDDGRSLGYAESLRALETFQEYPIKYHALDKQALRETLRIANQRGCTFQDSCYLWLAQDLKCRFLTDDREFVRRLPEEIVNEFVQLLQ
jgi:predicted nucleic acid-binding protein